MTIQTLALASVPNQTFTAVLDGDRYEIAIYVVGSTMAVDVTRNEIAIVTGMRIVGTQFFIPYIAYYGGQHGNFLLQTVNDDLPDYTQFGMSQTLVYMSFSDILDAVLTA